MTRPMTHWKAALVILSLAIVFAACSSAEPFEGTELTAGEPATPFELVSQNGRSVTLSDYAGKVILLTFLYTSCPDLCPAVTADLRDTHRLLGDVADEVAFVAISVDPARDSVESAREYSDRWEMTERWDFLVGDEETLSQIWKAYYIDPGVDRGSEDDETGSDQDSDHNDGAPDRLAEDSYLIIHSAPVYLIDKEGIRRILFTPPLEPEALAHDIKRLVN